ncbi:cation diffusion facilitator family transporter [Fictibacillus gelatini]|uniref:cation diffusion facilitator family transporter n=1 Tax=Fictibacillus gelatini TaxID=225985 RepID=UPI0003F54E8E|nr:cation diffusion facilitator family transporter [Fictibacillus gelatini]
MGHGHDHHHIHHKNKKSLLLAFLLTLSFMVAEIIGGIITNSLALISDSGHMLSDAISLGFSLLAFKLGEKRSTEHKTYGYKRFEILAALFNGIALIVVSLYIFWEAIGRFQHPPVVASNGMLTIALIGFVINVLAAWILMKGDTSENLNLRSAFLHVIGDLLGSVGAIVAALLIMFFGWEIADPIASSIVGILVFASAIRVTKDALHVLMEGKPSHIRLEEIERHLLTIPKVENVHDLHVWSLSSDFPMLTCHLKIEVDSDEQIILRQAAGLIEKEFHIAHSTIQIEKEPTDCHCVERCEWH